MKLLPGNAVTLNCLERAAPCLEDGEYCGAANVEVEVSHVRRYSPGSVALHERSRETPIARDACHAHDVGWINAALGRDRRAQRRRSIERLRPLGTRHAYSGHGTAIGDAAASARGDTIRLLMRWEQQSADVDERLDELDRN